MRQFCRKFKIFKTLDGNYGLFTHCPNYILSGKNTIDFQKNENFIITVIDKLYFLKSSSLSHVRYEI